MGMGSDLFDLISSKELDLRSLRNKTVTVDAFNTIYMFLTNIRGRDGSPLTNADGEPTSHLVGLYNRFTKYMEKGIDFVFVFDGESPDLKKEEQERRKKKKKKAKEKYEEAKKEEDVQNMKKYAARQAVLDQKKISESKRLIRLMGMGVVDAPSEGEAQAAHMVKKGDAYAVVTQDADSLLNGATRVIRNLSISGRRKMPGTQSYKTVKPELIELNKVLDDLDITQDQLIALALLIGTDYNYGGVKGIGPKRGIKKVRKYEDDFQTLFEEVGWQDHFDTSWEEVFSTIKDMEVTDDYKFETGDYDADGITKMLVEEKDFSQDRVDKKLKKLKKAREVNKQKGIGDFV